MSATGKSEVARTERIAPKLALYGLPVVSFGCALIVSLAAAAATGHRFLVLFLIPVVISGYVAGRGAALLAAVLLSLFTAYFMFPSAPVTGNERPVDFTTWLALVATAILITVLQRRSPPARTRQLLLSRRAEALDRTLAVTEWKVRGGFLIALSCLGVVGGVSYLSVVRLDEAVDWVSHTQDVLRSTRLMVTAITSAEMQERGYVITGNENDIRTFPNAIQQAVSQLPLIKELIEDNPVQEQRLAVLSPIIMRRMQILSETVLLRRAQGFEAARAVVAAGPGRELHDQILVGTEEMIAEENRLLLLREKSAQRSSAITYAVISTGGGVAAIVVWFVLFALRRDFASRMLTERRIRTANENLEARVAERTAKLEETALQLAGEIEERGKAQAKLQSQFERSSLLHHITRAIGEQQTLASIYAVVLDTLESHLPVVFCGICNHMPKEEFLTVVAIGAQSGAAAQELRLMPSARLPIGKNGLSRCLDGHLVYEPDLFESQFTFPQSLARLGLRSLVIAPLQIEKKVLGVLLCVRREPQGFVSGECEFLRQLSEHVALGAHQAQLHEALRNAYEEQRQSQSVALQQERLRALGQMASGIAHDINNAISPVTLYVESLMHDEPTLSASGRERAEIIGRAISDVAQTVSRLREFSRQREPQTVLRPVDLNEIARHVIGLTHARWSDMALQRGVFVRVNAELGIEMPPIMGIESELRDALVNLMFNAVDAMPDGGLLTLRTSLIDASTPYPGGPTKFLRLEVADTGVGMNEEARRRCLEPFYTTKGERGTGLGLAMVYGTMQRHGSDIEIDSEVGSATTFRFNFPVPPARAIESTTVPLVAIPPLAILVIDDDALVSGAVRDTLKKDGHRVTTADGGRAGIDAFLTSVAQGAPFQVVITDLGMPFVDGHEVSRLVKEADPATIVILLTGWGTRLAGDIPPLNVDYLVSKPPSREALRSALAGSWGKLRAGQ
jgi:signal transduction histidine kinase/CHASE3 domain sensor protein